MIDAPIPGVGPKLPGDKAATPPSEGPHEPLAAGLKKGRRRWSARHWSIGGPSGRC
jgi:hypothetical protein